jgi:hypothetical protein
MAGDILKNKNNNVTKQNKRTSHTPRWLQRNSKEILVARLFLLK